MTRARDVANLIGSGNYSSTTFTATAGQTAFTISHTQGFVQVFMNGLLLDETVDYTSNGSAVTLTSGAAAGDEIEVVAYNTFSVGDALNTSAADARYYTQSAADTRYVNTSGDTMTGNLGIGATPSNSRLYITGSGFAGQLLIAPTTSAYVGVGHGTDHPAIHWQTGDFRFATSTARDLTGFSEKMRIANNGNVGIGISTIDNTYSSSHALQIASVSDNNWSGTLILSSADGSSVFSRLVASTDGLDLINTKATNMRFFTNNAERMRITSGGNLLVGATAPLNSVDGIYVATTGANVQAFTTSSTTNSSYYIGRFHSTNTEIGSIYYNGSSVSYNTSSDYRLKENITDVTDGITRVKQLSPKRFNWIADESNTTVDGFLAHEAQTVVPEAVTGTKDGLEVWTEKEKDELPDGVSVGDNKLDDDGNTIPEYQQIDQAKIVPLLTAALQEAIAKIEILETKVAALEGG